LVAVTEMPIGRCRTDPRPSCSFREGKPGWSFLRDQLERGADQGLFQIAVVIAARTGTPALPGPAHVKGFYMTRRVPSTLFGCVVVPVSLGTTGCAGVPGSRGESSWRRFVEDGSRASRPRISNLELQSLGMRRA